MHFFYVVQYISYETNLSKLKTSSKAMANISEVPLGPEMKSEDESDFIEKTLLELEQIFDDESSWVNFGVGGPA